MSTHMTLERARAIGALLDGIYEPPVTARIGVPGLEVTVLPPDEGWKQWDAAVRLRDISDFGDS